VTEPDRGALLERRPDHLGEHPALLGGVPVWPPAVLVVKIGNERRLACDQSYGRGRVTITAAAAPIAAATPASGSVWRIVAGCSAPSRAEMRRLTWRRTIRSVSRRPSQNVEYPISALRLFTAPVYPDQ
jgi:hypothetical protein